MIFRSHCWFAVNIGNSSFVRKNARGEVMIFFCCILYIGLRKAIKSPGGDLIKLADGEGSAVR